MIAEHQTGWTLSTLTVCVIHTPLQGWVGTTSDRVNTVHSLCVMHTPLQGWVGTTSDRVNTVHSVYHTHSSTGVGGHNIRLVNTVHSVCHTHSSTGVGGHNIRLVKTVHSCVIHTPLQGWVGTTSDWWILSTLVSDTLLYRCGWAQHQTSEHCHSVCQTHSFTGVGGWSEHPPTDLSLSVTVIQDTLLQRWAGRVL